MPTSQSRAIRLIRFKDLVSWLSLLFVAWPVQADVITMTNGDRISGSIKRVWDGELYIEPSYGDEFSVDLDAVATIETDAPYEIELQDHSETVGRLAVDERGQPVLVTDAGSQPFPPMSIEELNEVDDYFDWEARSDLSANVSRGNTDTTDMVWQAEGGVKFGDHRHQLFLSSQRSSQDGTTTKEQDKASYNYSWFFREPWFVQAGVGYERDPIRDLTYRYTPGAGLGYQFFNDAGRRLEVSLAGVAVIEKIGGSQEESFAPRWTLDYRRKMLGGDLEFFHRHALSTYMSGRANEVLDSSTGIRWDVWDDVYFNVQIDYDWESNPSSGNQKDDTTFLIGAGVALD